MNVLFIGGNYPFHGSDPFSANPQDVDRNIVELANYIVHHTEISLLGIPERNENKIIAQTTNDILEALAKRCPKEPEVLWKYRSKSTYLSGKYYLPEGNYFLGDKFHLNATGGSNLHHLTNEKVLSEHYDEASNENKKPAVQSVSKRRASVVSDLGSVVIQIRVIHLDYQRLREVP